MQHDDATTPRNRLAAESSPYLLQHAANPVDWHPWDETALALARREGKPILLSIGYSACHWCHVMAHESFADEATARVMNELFVNIKVDREERPDLDRIYQLAHQMLTQRGGGWPLTMFLSPQDQRPFFGGTYFPREPRYGMPAFTEILRRVAEFYRTRSTDIAQQSQALAQAFAGMLPPPATTEQALTATPLGIAREALAHDFDTEFGGFGSAPKFPHPSNIDFLLRAWRDSAASDEPDLHSLYMATLTLTRMAEGGLYDQLGGGFSRYSVDQYWMVPHFEKMLYDNAQLLRLYAQASRATGDALFERIAHETASFLLRDLRAPDGAYWSTLDADSEGHEGKFYVWEAEAVRRLLPENDYAAFARRFGLDREPNFEGHWHLHVYRSLEDVGIDLGLDTNGARDAVDRARAQLLEVRNARIWPGRDEKILTSWNGLAIGALAVTARALQRQDLADAATRAIDFIRNELWRDGPRLRGDDGTATSSGRLLAVHKDGRSRFPAYLDDYAFLLEGVIESLQTHFRTADLAFATALAETLLAHFEDREGGGFFFTADDHEALIHRSKSFQDEAVPSGNALATQALTRLGLLLGETRYLDAAARTLRAAWAPLEQYPHAHAALLVALREHLEPPEIVIIRGDDAARWRDALARTYAPHRLVFAIPSDTHDLPPALADKKPSDTTVAYVCRGMTCSPPVKTLDALLSLSA